MAFLTSVGDKSPPDPPGLDFTAGKLSSNFFFSLPNVLTGVEVLEELRLPLDPLLDNPLGFLSAVVLVTFRVSDGLGFTSVTFFITLGFFFEPGDNLPVILSFR